MMKIKNVYRSLLASAILALAVCAPSHADSVERYFNYKVMSPGDDVVVVEVVEVKGNDIEVIETRTFPVTWDSSGYPVIDLVPLPVEDLSGMEVGSGTGSDVSTLDDASSSDGDISGTSSDDANLPDISGHGDDINSEEEVAEGAGDGNEGIAGKAWSKLQNVFASVGAMATGANEWLSSHLPGGGTPSEETQAPESDAPIIETSEPVEAPSEDSQAEPVQEQDVSTVHDVDEVAVKA